MRKKGNFFIITGLLLIAAALLLTGYNIWDNHRAGAAAETVLEQLSPMVNDDPVPYEGRVVNATAGVAEGAAAAITGEIEYPDFVINPDMDMPVVQIDGYYYIGVISIPAIERELPVFETWDYSKLNIAPCRYTGTAYRDNMVICAHNFEDHFGNLKYMNYGDQVIFTDMDGNVFVYEVMEIETVDPTAIEHMIIGDWDLTLFTCTIGGATRVTVRCERVSPAKK